MVHCEKGKSCRATKLDDSCNHDCGHCVVDSEAKFTDGSVLYSSKEMTRGIEDNETLNSAANLKSS